MLIDVSVLVRLGLSPTQARTFAAPLDAACRRFGIDTPVRLAGFVAQCRVESRDFTALEESLYYSTAERLAVVYPSVFQGPSGAAPYLSNPQRLANRVYAGRLGNGDEASGDGWRYRGRGLIQLTGRANYTAAAAGCARRYVEDPSAVALPADAALTAAWYWHARNCNEPADASNWREVTRRINGPALLELSRRAQYAESGVRELSQVLA